MGMDPVVDPKEYALPNCRKELKFIYLVEVSTKFPSRCCRHYVAHRHDLGCALVCLKIS